MTRTGESIEAKSSLVAAQGWEALGQGDRRGPPLKGTGFLLGVIEMS